MGAGALAVGRGRLGPRAAREEAESNGDWREICAARSCLHVRARASLCSGDHTRLPFSEGFSQVDERCGFGMIVINMAKPKASVHKQKIPCRVAPGMFSSERAVEVQGRWYFVDARHVSSSAKSDTGELEVTVVVDGGARWAMIPSCEPVGVALSS